MPDPPAENLFTRFVLENNYPLAIGLVVVGLVIGWLALREGRLERLRLAAVPVVLGVATLGAGMFVVTASERAKTVVRALVDDVVAGDLVGTLGHFSDDARMHFGSTQNPALDLDGIRTILSRFDRVVTIEKNRITELRGFTTSSETATVHLGNRTETSLYPTASQCVVAVKRTADGTWKVERVTIMTINGQAPPSSW